MKYFLNLFAVVILCSWSGECHFNSGDDESGGSGATISDSGSRSSRANTGNDDVSEADLLKLARQISAANQAKWEEYAKTLPAAGRDAEYQKFIAENPVDVNLIYEYLKEQAKRQSETTNEGT